MCTPGLPRSLRGPTTVGRAPPQLPQNTEEMNADHPVQQGTAVQHTLPHGGGRRHPPRRCLQEASCSGWQAPTLQGPGSTTAFCCPMQPWCPCPTGHRWHLSPATHMLKGPTAGGPAEGPHWTCYTLRLQVGGSKFEAELSRLWGHLPLELGRHVWRKPKPAASTDPPKHD